MNATQSWAYRSCGAVVKVTKPPAITDLARTKQSGRHAVEHVAKDGTD